MNSKQLALDAINHKNTARIPVDFGGTIVSGIHVTSVEQLRKHFGLAMQAVKVIDPYQMLGEIDKELCDAIGVDTQAIYPRNNMFGYANENWKEWTTPWGQKVLVGEKFEVTRNDKGDTLIYPEGDRNAIASGRMPASGKFFDTIIRQEPIVEEELNPQNNLEEFKPIKDIDLNHFVNQISKTQEDKLTVATLGGTAFGDIALVPAPFLKNPKGIRDIQEWYLSTIMRPDYLHEVFAKQTEVAIENLNRIYQKVGNKIDVLFMCGTDFGTQDSTFCSGETYMELYHPYYKKINEWIHANTTWKTMKHSCGAVKSFIPNFIESGFDILNPVQCSAADMDPKTLKNEFGKDIVFWGGGVDTQKTLPFGTPEEVKREVLERCEIFSKDGGFVFNTIHNIQANTPIENIIAMIDAVKRF